MDVGILGFNLSGVFQLFDNTVVIAQNQGVKRDAETLCDGDQFTEFRNGIAILPFLHRLLRYMELAGELFLRHAGVKPQAVYGIA